jgi:hypothetical protein
MTHVDQNIDWFAHARERKRAFELKTQQAARALAEKKALPPPPPPPVIPELVAVEKAPPPMPEPLAKLIDYRPAWRIIAQQVCEKHKIPLTELQGNRRFKRLSIARREVFWRLRTELRMSLLDIARKMGKDHTTILHGLRVYVRDNPPPPSTGEEACNTVRS